MEEMIINGKTYVEKNDQAMLNNPTEIKIVVLQRGWVLIGRFEKEGTNCKLHDASVIRSWGTTKGLGELAISGKTKDTKLDKCGGLVEFDILTVVLKLSVNESLWKKEL